MTQDATSGPGKGRISPQSQLTPMGYPAEMQVIAMHIKDIQEGHDRWSHWVKVVRVGSHLHIASYYLDAPTFKQWVETELHMYPQIAATYIEFSLKKAPVPALEQRELDAIRAKHVSEGVKTMPEAAENDAPQGAETQILSPAEQMKTMKKPWLRMNSEKTLWFNRFKRYLDLGLNARSWLL